MTDKQLTIKVIDKARWNGWRLKYWKERNLGEYIPLTSQKQGREFKKLVDSKGRVGRRVLEYLQKNNISISKILFDEGFCRFFFGYEYTYHLSQIRKTKNPIRYFEKFL